MKTYKEFHGEIPINDIGRRLREIARIENKSFKILTGYGSSSGKSLSKDAAIKSLKKMKKDNLIKGFLPGEIKNIILKENDYFYLDKVKFINIIKNDPDYGNDVIIFVFM